MIRIERLWVVERDLSRSEMRANSRDLVMKDEVEVEEEARNGAAMESIIRSLMGRG